MLQLEAALTGPSKLGYHEDARGLALTNESYGHCDMAVIGPDYQDSAHLCHGQSGQRPYPDLA